MIKISGQNYLSLDSYLDIVKFDTIIDDIILGIAKSRYAAGPTNTGPGYLDKTKKSVVDIYREILDDSDNQYHSLIKSLKNWEPFTFIQYKWPSHVLGQCLILRSSGLGSYDSKDDKDKCIDYPIKSNFQSLLDYIDSQEIFASIGRIVIFLNEPGSNTIEHRDYADGISRNDEFIWICPLQNKRFYVRDDYEKTYVESKFCYFDSANIHGSDPVQHNTFSIRIDGKFSEIFKSRVGL